MRLLLLLILIGVGAYFTVPTRQAHESAAQEFLQNYVPAEAANVPWLDNLISSAKGMIAGQGRYETFYVFSKFTMDTPGAAYVECYGAFTMVRCQEVAPGAQTS